jgi:hypothetical protein
LSRKLLAAVLTLVLAGWLQGCGPSGGEMTPATASTLQRDVDAVVSAADASRWDAAIDALDQLEADVRGERPSYWPTVRRARRADPRRPAKGARRSAADPPLQPDSGSDHDHANHPVN